MGNKVVHWELMGPDAAALAGFYGDVFDWTPQETPGFAGYHPVDAEQTGVGGAVGQGSDEMPSYLTLYVEVDGIDSQLERINAAGGVTVLERTVIPGMATFALFSDPAGNIVESEVPAEE